MGNFYVESKLNPICLQGSYSRKLGMSSEEYTAQVDNGTYSKDSFVHDGAGYGLAQWTYHSRKESLYDYAKEHGQSIGDLDMQLNFMWHELQSYKTALNAVLTATNIRDASDVFAKRYEKPLNKSEEFLSRRAQYGYDFYNKFAGDVTMNTWKQVDGMLSEWKGQHLSKPELVVKLANATIGWPYVYGGRGEECTPSGRKSRSNPNSPTIVSKCQVLNGSKGSCNGCRWHPGGTTLFYDCRGFTYWLFLKGADIKITGAGATTQFNTDSNWEVKGKISDMPKDKVCCVFRYDSSTRKMEHTLLYDGNGNYIHCSGEVKKVPTSKYNATHYAIPKGLYDGGEVIVTEKATVHADKGSSVNMRAQASTSADLVERVPVGTIVDVYDHGSSWSKISYKGRTGYMMNQFLIFGEYTPGEDTPSEENIIVPRKELLEIYNKIGALLGFKG